MTLDEAIKHAEEVAEENQAIVDACDYYGDNMAKCEKCAEEHRQLAAWLKELKAYRAGLPIIEIDGKKYIAEKPKLKTVHKEGEVVIAGFREVQE